ncbi:MAG: dihydroxy-acid dehydratase [Proteobacteria bacterium]|nr:dihydroxy-acid dehydratase [Pseudomonadota bacterium]
MINKKDWKTKKYYHGPSGAHRRAVYKAMGYTTDDLSRPLIAIVNTWGEVCPGHYHLDHLTRTVRDGIWKAGGTPLEFAAISQCPTASLGEPMMRYDLPTRDLLAFDIEAIIEQQIFDGMVILVSCDKVVPGALLAAARLDLPCLILPGGCMEVGSCEGEQVSLSDLDEVIFGALPMGKADLKKIELLEDAVCPSPGACPIMGTANTMQCLAEAVGLTLPFAATARAVSAERLRLGKASGEAIVRMVRRGETARSILGAKNLENMLRVCMALGGSTNGILHILALARELGLAREMNIEKVDRFSRTTPCISDVRPVGKYFLPDLHEDGGVPAIMAELKPFLNLQARGAGGRSVGDWVKLGRESLKRGRRTVRALDDPLLAHGGIAVLKGNLAPISSLARMLNNTIPSHRGPARCFNSQEEAVAALKKGKVKGGEVIVVRYAGPRGAPGMPDIYALLATVVGMGLEGKLAVVTDGRFSGFARGLGVCQVSPEAAVGGPLALVKNGDILSISLPDRSLNAEIPAQEWKTRAAAWQPPKMKNAPGILGLFAVNAEQAHQGARLVAHPAPWKKI